MKCFTLHYSVLPKAFVIFVACFLAFIFAPQRAFAQHGGGGGHAGGHFGGGHFGGGHYGRSRGHWPPLVGAGTHKPKVARRQAVAPAADFSTSIVAAGRVATPARMFPPRRFPRFPFLFGFRGPFFGGFDLWSPVCGPFWIGGFGCDSFPYYGFGYSSGSLAGQANYFQGWAGQQDSLFTDDYPPLNSSEPPSDNSATQSEAVLYLLDGSVSGLRDYWFAGGKLHYVTDYGFENAVDLDVVNLRETVNENALRGIKFMF